MSHDRGCFRCFEDTRNDCGRRNCPYAKEETPKKVEGMKLDLNEEDDFGFTVISEQEVNQEDMQAKLEGLRKMIMPLLNNLKKNPEKEYIHWPNRVEKIDQFINKMNKYIDG